MMRFLLTALVIGLLYPIASHAQQTTIATTLPYGEQLEFTVDLANGQDSVYVDWGDGQRKGYKEGQRSWHTNTWVHGKLLADTIRMYGAIKRIDIDDDSVTVLQFQNQPKLESIYASKNKLTNDGLDISGCPNLKVLDISHNNMMYLSLLNHASLESFDVSNNPEFNTAVFAANNGNLRTIDMDNCDIVHFYPVKLPGLSTLSIKNGSLLDIDLSDNYPSLSTLNLSGNKYLSSIDVTQMPNLFSLSISNTAITELNISQNKELNSITIDHTGISKLNLQNATGLRSLSVRGCPISKLDVRNLTNLAYIYADSTQITRLDLSANRFVRNLSLRATNVEFIDLHKGIGYNTLKSIDLRDCKGFTAQTLNFTFDAMPPHEGSSYSTNVWLAGTAYEHANTDLLEYDSENYYKSDVEGDGTASMDSILIVPQTVVGGTYTIQQEGNSSEHDADGNYFPFRTINPNNKVIPGYPLKIVPVADEGYTFKGVEVNGKFYDDSLFVVSTAGATVKPVFSNATTCADKIVLTVPGGVQQQYFLASANDGDSITVDWGDGQPVTYRLSASKKTTVACDGGTQGTTVTITGPVIYADFSSYPGVANDNEISAIDISGNEHLKYLTTYMNEIGTLDVSKEKDLIQLDCSYSGLETLDVSNNTKLLSLKAYGNELDNLDVSGLTELLELDLKGNYLDSIDLSNNSKLEVLHLQNNSLKKLDVSNMAALAELQVFGNELTTLDLSHNANLVELSAHSNKLAHLDLAQNTDLEYLNVNGNNLDMLDLSKNTNLNYINVAKNGWNACTLNDFYYLLPQYPEGVQLGENEEKTRLRVYGNTTSSNPDNDCTHAESVIATGKGWIIDSKGDGTGCQDAYVTLLPSTNGTATMATEDGTAVPSGSKVKKNTVVVVTAVPAEGYQLQTVKANGKVAKDGKFTVEAATEVLVQFTVATSVEGIGTVSTTVKGGNGELLFETSSPIQVAVYTLGGKLVYSSTVNGNATVALQPAVYVVKVGKETRKVIVR